MLLTGITTPNCVFMINTSFKEITDLGPGVFPLFPFNASKSPYYPVIQGLENIAGFCEAIIVPPASKIKV